MLAAADIQQHKPVNVVGPSRRAALAGAAVLLPLGATFVRQAAAAESGVAGSLAASWMASDDTPQFVRTPDGVKVQVVAEGSGPAAAPGDRLLLDYVLRRDNGYFIYSTVEGVSFQPRDLPTGPLAVALGSGELIAGLEEVLTGMRAGGKVRALVPPGLGYEAAPAGLPQMPTFATRRQLDNHRREDLLFEVQLLRVLPQGRM